MRNANTGDPQRRRDAMIADFAIAPTIAGSPRKSVTMNAESSVTFARNCRSRWPGILGHDGPESPVTMPRNTHPTSCRARRHAGVLATRSRFRPASARLVDGAGAPTEGFGGKSAGMFYGAGAGKERGAVNKSGAQLHFDSLPRAHCKGCKIKIKMNIV